MKIIKVKEEQIVDTPIERGRPTVSIERIYQHIWVHKKKKGDLDLHMRYQGRRYRKRGNEKDNREIITFNSFRNQFSTTTPQN